MPFPIELAYRAFGSSPSDPESTESELLRDRSIWYSVQTEHRWVIDLFNTREQFLQIPWIGSGKGWNCLACTSKPHAQCTSGCVSDLYEL